MKKKKFAGLMVYPYKDFFVIKIDRLTKKGTYHELESKYYKFRYTDPRIFHISELVTRMIDKHHKNIINELRILNGN